jgi:hypothetical protein
MISVPRLLALALLAALPVPLSAAAQEVPLTAESRSALALTIYNQGFGLVSERRRATLPAGETLLAIEDVSGQMQPETVLLSAPGLRIVEQSLAADLLTPQRLLEASLGETVEWIRSHPETGEDQVSEATVLSLAGGLVLQIGERVEINPPGRIAFTSLPAGLRSAPALLARVLPAQAGATELQIDYLTHGLSWRADYVARLNRSADRLDLQALVTLTNGTDSDFEGATLRLVAGEVNIGAPVFKTQQYARGGMEMAMAAAPAADMSGPQAAGDRYVYSLARPANLKRGETKQIPLMAAPGVAVTREYRFEELLVGLPGREEVGPVSAAIILELENDPALGLGAPLPQGTVRVYGSAPEAGGATLFLGADGIGHTPVGEKARLNLGSAYDVTARATRTVFERLSDRAYETGQKIVVKNAKDEVVEVVVAGQLPPGWTMREENAPHEQDSASRVSWRLTVPAGGETELTYRIRVSN